VRIPATDRAAAAHLAVMSAAAPAPTMLRIVSLNLWGGQAFDALLAFVREHAPATDIFCFQEALNAPVLLPLACGFRTSLYRELALALPEFAGVFDPLVAWDEPTDDGTTVHVPFGLATFARRTLPLGERRAARIIEHADTLDAADGMHRVIRRLQLTEVRLPGSTLLVANFHGIARPGTKRDTDERLAQSEAIHRTLAAHDGPVVLTGDFNLLPDTASVQIIEDGLCNLVMERAIPTTRSRLNPYYGQPEEQKHADYTFVSPGLRVADFRVPDVAVSDHLPLLLTLDLTPEATTDA
jgi:endonuclease/exonuclease/phosphatase family metal-dependent hydrolase